MSSPLAIAAVTAVLKSFLENSLISHDLAAVLGGNVTVSAEPPDRIKSDTGVPDRINLFLFQVTENQAWRNLAQPARNGNGDRIANQPLALDLSYLLTAYGAGDFHAEALLGHAMFALHEMPVLTRQAIREAIPAPPPATLPNRLTSADLAGQIEQIRITPQTMSVEEIAKIWSALHTQYRPTAVYKVSVVLIESRKSGRPALPVTARRIAVAPLQRPVIDAILSQATPADPPVTDQPILAGYHLVIDGQQLQGETTRVVIDEAEIVPAGTQLSDARVVVPLPAALQPGLHSVRIAHPVNFGTPASPALRRGAQSNVAAFVLAPQISTPLPDTPRAGTLSLGISPPTGRLQKATVLLGERTLAIPPREAAVPDPSPTLDVAIPADFPPGDHLVRVQIDGAESALEADASGLFTGPTVKIVP